MANIRKLKGVRGIRYQVQVRKHGIALARTFDRQDDAKAWARDTERAIDIATPERPFTREEWLQLPVDSKRPERGAEREEERDPDDYHTPQIGWTLYRALRYYGETVSPTKKGEVQETKRIRWWREQRLTRKKLIDIKTEDINEHIKRRIDIEKKAKQTVRNEINLISNLYRVARTTWKLAVLNPVEDAEKPKGQPKRKRRLRRGEEAALVAQIQKKALGAEMLDYFLFSLATGLRRGEGLAVLKKNCIYIGEDENIPCIQLWDSKNGDWRNVILNNRADEIIQRRIASIQDPDGKVFNLNSNQVEWNWRDCKRKAGVPELHWHDLRHEAISRLVSLGLNIAEVKEQSGHKTDKIVMEYMHAQVENIKGKLG